MSRNLRPSWKGFCLAIVIAGVAAYLVVRLPLVAALIFVTLVIGLGIATARHAGFWPALREVIRSLLFDW